MSNQNQKNTNDTIWVLVDSPSGGDLDKYAGPVQINVEKLGEHFEAFTDAISKALGKVSKPIGLKSEFELDEITLEATLSAEIGFTLVSKGGIEGTFGFTYKKIKTA